MRRISSDVRWPLGRKNGNVFKFKTKLIEGMQKRGYDTEFAEQIFKHRYVALVSTASRKVIPLRLQYSRIVQLG
ncbi:hypothetical protein OK016_02985 [Vibrio chagasii]|nr:hypothetical protein [Vibrio chagasii]